MKIEKQGEGYWDIINEGKVIGSIESVWRYNRAHDKILYIGEKEIGKVANQKEAIEKVKLHLNNK